MSPNVNLLVGTSVSQDFDKRDVRLPCFYRSTCYHAKFGCIGGYKNEGNFVLIIFF